jgi:hypothetical protein
LLLGPFGLLLALPLGPLLFGSLQGLVGSCRGQEDCQELQQGREPLDEDAVAGFEDAQLHQKLVGVPEVLLDGPRQSGVLDPEGVQEEKAGLLPHLVYSVVVQEAGGPGDRVGNLLPPAPGAVAPDSRVGGG